MKAARVETDLNTYGVFDKAVIDPIAWTATWQDELTFRDLAKFYGVEDGPATVLPSQSDRLIDVVHFSPLGDGFRPSTFDGSRARVLFSPMGVDANPSMAMRGMRLYGADPEEQLLVVSSPSIPGKGAGKVATRSLSDVWRGNFRPLVEPTLCYLNELGVENATFLGYSAGAELAVASAQHAANYDVGADIAVVAEAPGLHPRSLGRLVTDFLATGSQLEEYIERSQSPPLNEARTQMGGNVGLYIAGLLRGTNIAFAHAMSQGKTGERLSDALSRHKSLRATVAYNGESGLVYPDGAKKVVSTLRGAYQDRVSEFVVPGAPHAAADNINFHAALMLQGIRLAQPT